MSEFNIIFQHLPKGWTFSVTHFKRKGFEVKVFDNKDTWSRCFLKYGQADMIQSKIPELVHNIINHNTLKVEGKTVQEAKELPPAKE